MSHLRRSKTKNVKNKNTGGTLGKAGRGRASMTRRLGPPVRLQEDLPRGSASQCQGSAAALRKDRPGPGTVSALPYRGAQPARDEAVRNEADACSMSNWTL